MLANIQSCTRVTIMELEGSKGSVIAWSMPVRSGVRATQTAQTEISMGRISAVMKRRKWGNTQIGQSAFSPDECSGRAGMVYMLELMGRSVVLALEAGSMSFSQEISREINFALSRGQEDDFKGSEAEPTETEEVLRGYGMDEGIGDGGSSTELFARASGVGPRVGRPTLLSLGVRSSGLLDIPGIVSNATLRWV
ncbi:hypothetical protein BDR06DRAFT_973118 [Suillus hirtellus]|nr:hypothetical protein BDR06DRAFT_973118 [Suillus hirtellus]